MGNVAAASGRTRPKLSNKLKLPSTKGNYTDVVRLTNGNVVYIGTRGGTFYFLCTCGVGRGFVNFADAITTHECLSLPTKGDRLSA